MKERQKGSFFDRLPWRSKKPQMVEDLSEKPVYVPMQRKKIVNQSGITITILHRGSMAPEESIMLGQE